MVIVGPQGIMIDTRGYVYGLKHRLDYSEIRRRRLTKVPEVETVFLLNIPLTP